jgi:dTDP-4-amino-4,6-dideoxygalactose transaminase
MQHKFLPFALPELDETEFHEIKEVLESGWITTGAKTRQLERELADFVGSPHAIAVNSCTAAMHLALEAIGLKQGDLVLTTPYTFAATSEVILYFRAIPIFVDVDLVTLNIDTTKLAEAADTLAGQSSDALSLLPPSLRSAADSRELGGRLKAIMPVHMAGYPCDLDTIYTIAARHGLAVIEDAAHALGTTYNNLPIGSPRHGSVQSAVCFSFYATKCLTTGEGGLICTDNQALVDHCRMMSLHGISKDAWKRYTAEGSWYYEILAPGFKYNMTDIAAGLGLAQLRKAERMRQRRCEIARCYTDAFGAFPEIQVPFESPSFQHAWHLYMLRPHFQRLRIERSQFIEELRNRQIGSSVHFIPLHIHPYYREKYGYKANDYPIAYREYQREISLPIYSKMTDLDVQRVVDAVTDIVVKHRR